MFRLPPLRAVSLAVLAAMTLPVSAQTIDSLRLIPAELFCKPQGYTTHSTISAQDARDRWSGHVRSLHGQSWATWAAARNTSQYTSQQPTGTIYVASGRPCRAVLMLQ